MASSDQLRGSADQRSASTRAEARAGEAGESHRGARRRASAAWRGIEEIIDGLDLSDLQKRALHSRWLDQVEWLEAEAARARRLYYSLRLITVVGAVAIPALIGLNLEGTFDEALAWTTFGLSLLVAVSAAVEEFLRFGARWRQYRRTAEQLKSEGWDLFQLSGPYRRFDDHASAYRSFAGRVEAVLRQDVDYYVTEIAAEKEQKESDKPGDEA